MELITLNILREGKRLSANPNHYHLYCVLKGESELRSDEETITLQEQQMVVRNPEEAHTVICRSGILADLAISYSEVVRLMGYQRKVIVCDTRNIQNETSASLLKLVHRLIKSICAPDSTRMQVEQDSLQLVFYLVSNYSINIFQETDSSRREEIRAYIEAHCAEELSLDDIADEFGLTPQYFSKFFHETFGITFLKYLNRTRLRHAVEELVSSDKTSIRIAIDHGFPNNASFIREFRQEYGTTPSEYRAAHRTTPEETPGEDVLLSLEAENEEEEGTTINVTVDASEEDFPLLEPYWTELFNLGSFTTMMKNDMMRETVYLIESLKFRKARLLLDTWNPNGKPDFYTADRVMEFFVRQRLDVIIVIDCRMIHDTDSFLSYFREQAFRFANRFGKSMQGHTTFELAYTTDFDDEKLNSYRKIYFAVKKILEESRYESDLIGPALLMDETGENFRRFVEANPDIPTFTICSAPYAVLRKGSEVFINRLTDSDYMVEQYRAAKRILEELRPDAKLLLVSWKDRLNDVDVLNETSYMGARIIRNVLSGYGTCSALPLDAPLDLMFDEVAYDRIFNLLPGILTAQGIPKPSFHALKLLDQQDRYLVKADQNCLITKSSEPGYYQILIHNCKKLGYEYYLNETLDDIDRCGNNLFEDSEPLTFHFRFLHLPKGSYLLKMRRVSDDSGSAFSRFREMKYLDDSFIGKGELEYLRAASVLPVEGMRETVNTDGELNVTCTLQANEFVHLHVIHIRN